MACFVEVFVVGARLLSSGSGRDDGGFSRPLQAGQDALVGVVAFVGDPGGCGHRVQQSVSPFQIARLPCGEVQAGRVAERIHGGMDLGAQPTLAASDGLVAPFLRAPALC